MSSQKQQASSFPFLAKFWESDVHPRMTVNQWQEKKQAEKSREFIEQQLGSYLQLTHNFPPIVTDIIFIKSNESSYVAT